jgi:endonuclease/exonuclease/phosphatase family metal-dependent hydrolase
MRRSIFALPAAALMVTSIVAAAPAQAAAPHIPGSFSAVSAKPGPNPGEVTFSWSQDGSYTTGYVLETALTSFSKTDPSMAVTGRDSHLLNISRSVRTITLTAAQVAADGAGVSSGNHLYFRFSAVNKDSTGATTPRNYPYLQAVLPQPQAPSPTAGKIRVASFNVRTARATDDARTWLQRAPDVAKQIVAYDPGLVAIQELGPGRADGQTGTLEGTARQTDSLQTALNGVGGSKYDLVRTTPYVQSGKPSASQGARIIYDTSRYILRSSCPDKTGTESYSSSCTIQLPLLSGDSQDLNRKATVAQFEDRASGLRFWFVSAHLDARHSDTAATETSYDGLRKNQANAITAAVNSLNTTNVPVIVGGDLNSWQNNKINNSPHDTLVAQGYYDTSAALTRVNFGYATINDFQETMVPASQGVGVRIDMLFVKGASGASRFENVMKVTDTQRPSDHNMIVADIAPFDAWGSVSVTTRGTRRR